MLKNLQKDLQSLKNDKKALIMAGFFKTGAGQYGEGDIFLGITVPQQRLLAKKYTDLDLDDLQKLLTSKTHEHRLVALFILVDQYKKADEKRNKQIVYFYLKNAKYVNNWDLVDSSADKILGEYLLGKKDRSILYKLVKSPLVWERRIAIVATYQFIKNNQFEDTFKICEALSKDKHDLIQKASGWMLREVGKRDLKALEKFLNKQYKVIPRTTLRYAIERFIPEKKAFYMKK